MSTDPVASVTNGASLPAQDSAETPSYKVFAGNLAYATTEEGLKAFFAPVASDIASIQVIYRGTRPAGYGFVAFSSLEAAEKAVAELDRKELDGRSVIIQIAKPAEDKEKDRGERRATGGANKKRVGRRGGKAPLGEVTDAEASGEPEATDKPAEQNDAAEARSKKPKKSRKPRRPRRENGEGAASGAEGAEGEAQNEGSGEKTARRPKPKRVPRPPRVPRAEGEAPVGEPSKNMLFVANLAFEVDDTALAEIFTSVGIKVNSARVVRRRFGVPIRRSKGFGFVDVGDEEQQLKAIELTQGKEINGRQIAVKIAVNATKEGEEGREEAGEHEEEN